MSDEFVPGIGNFLIVKERRFANRFITISAKDLGCLSVCLKLKPLPREQPTRSSIAKLPKRREIGSTIERVLVSRRELSKFLRDPPRAIVVADTGVPPVKVVDGLRKYDVGTRILLRGYWRRFRMLPPKRGTLTNKSDHVQRNLLRKHDDRIILDRIRGEPLRKPGRQFAKEECIRHDLIHDACARVESGLNAVAMDDGLAEAVDRRGGQFVKPRRCFGEC